MTYTKQVWVDQTTPVDAAHMNHMEDGIALADDVKYRGDWSSSTTYDAGDVVVYTDGFAYMCVKDGTFAVNPAPFPGSNGGIPLPVVNGQWVKGVGGAAVWSPLATDTVSATPPASPVDGQLWTLPADTTNGIMWVFRYRAASASAYKWEFVGGAPLALDVSAAGSTSSAVSVDLAAVQAFTLPRAGDYRFTWGADCYGPLGIYCFMFLQLALVDQQYAVQKSPVANTEISVASAYTAFGVAAGTDARVRYQSGTSGQTVNFLKRHFAIQPVRVA